MPVPFFHPCSVMISGPSGSGKTVFLRRAITENMIYPPPKRIVIVFGEWQKEYERLAQYKPDIEFCKGPMTEDLYSTFSPNENNLLVVDDQMADASKSNQLEKYFVQGSHHRNLTVVFIVQNLFEKGQAMRTSSLNTHYLVLFKHPRDKGQVGILGRQMYPSKWRNFVSVMEDATSAPYSYLVVDLKPDTPEEYRIRGNIFPDQTNDMGGTDVYII